MVFWQTVEFWIGVGAGMLAEFAFWAWSTWIYDKGKESVTEKPEGKE